MKVKATFLHFLFVLTSFASLAQVNLGIYPLATASGTDTYTATVTPAFSAYTSGQRFNIKFTNANTGAATININSKGAKSIVKNGSTALSSGDISAGQILLIQYDGTNMQIVGGSGSAGESGTAASFAEALLGTDNTKFITPKINAYVGQRVYNVKAYGADGDGQLNTDGAMTATSAVLTSAAGGFASTDVGKYIKVGGAGAAGVDLVTTIASYESSTQVTLTAAASTTVSSADIHWGTDNTTAIQAAIQACFDAGGGVVYIPIGVYIIAGALESANSNAQLYIPQKDHTDTNLFGISIIGESRTTPWVDQSADGAALKNGGVILRSLIVGNGTRPRVIGAQYGVPGGYNFNRTQLHIENITIQVRSRTGNSHVTSSIAAFGMGHMASVDLINCAALIESTTYNSTEPTSTSSVGFELPFINSNAIVNISGCVAIGYYKGFELSDHANVKNSLARNCVRGLVYGSANQASWTDNFVVFRCKYAVVFEGNAYIHHGYIGIEDETDNTKWWYPVYQFYAPSAVTVYGKIRYYNGTSGVDAVQNGTFNGAFYLERIGFSRKRMIVGGKGLPTNGGTGEWNGTLDVPIFEIGDLVEESSSGGLHPTFAMSHKQSSTSGLVAKQIIFNTYITPTTADKRISVQNYYTDGSTQKGILKWTFGNGAGGTEVLHIGSEYFKSLRPLIVDSDISPAALAANTNDYAPTGIATAATLRISATSAVDLTGIAGGATMVDGRELTVINTGTTNTITLRSDVTSTAANRFLLNADFALSPNMAVKLVYDGTSSRWRKLY